MATQDEILVLLQRLEDDIISLPGKLKLSSDQIFIVTGLSELSEDLGMIMAGEFRSGNRIEPGKGFSGMRMAYPPMTYSGETWNLVGVENDVLQFGVRASDGKALAGAGAVILDENGITLIPSSIVEEKSTIKFITGSSTVATISAYANALGGTNGLTLLTQGGLGRTLTLESTGGLNESMIMLYSVHTDSPINDAYVRIVAQKGASITSYVEIDPLILLPEITDLPGIAYGYGSIYVKTDGSIYFKNGAGIEYRLNIGSVTATQFLYNDASSDIAGYKQLLINHSEAAKETLTYAGMTNGQVLEEFATEPNSPGTHFLYAGTYDVHIHALQSAGTKVASIKASIYKRTSGGTETLLGTTAVSTALTAAETEYDLLLALGDLNLDLTDRLVVKIIGVVTGLGTDPTVSIYVEGDTYSHFSFPALAQSGTMNVTTAIVSGDALIGSGLVVGSSSGSNNPGAGEIWLQEQSALPSGTTSIDKLTNYKDTLIIINESGRQYLGISGGILDPFLHVMIPRGIWLGSIGKKIASYALLDRHADFDLGITGSFSNALLQTSNLFPISYTLAGSGTGNYLSYATASDLEANNYVCVMGWFYIPSTGANIRPLITYGVTDPSWEVYIYNNTVTGTILTASSQFWSGAKAITPDAWNFITFEHYWASTGVYANRVGVNGVWGDNSVDPGAAAKTPTGTLAVFRDGGNYAPSYGLAALAICNQSSWYQATYIYELTKAYFGY